MKLTYKTLFVFIISLLILLVFFLPHYEVFNIPAETQTGVWQSAYIFQDYILVAIYAPLVLFWILFLTIKNRKARTVFKFIILAFVTLIATTVFFALTMISPDVKPAIGTYASLIFFLATFIFLVAENKLSGKEIVKSRNQKP